MLLSAEEDGGCVTDARRRLEKVFCQIDQRPAEFEIMISLLDIAANIPWCRTQNVPKMQARESSSMAPSIIKKEVGNSRILDLIVILIIVGRQGGL